MKKIELHSPQELLEYGILAKGPWPLVLEGVLKYERPAFLFEPRRFRNVIFGAFSIINYTAAVYPARIGRYCSIAEQVTLGPAEHPVDWLSSHPFAFTRPSHLPNFYRMPDFARLAPDTEDSKFTMPLITDVGHDAWVGAGAFVKRGVRIGDGAIVAAGSVVTKDVPPYAIVGGIPAKVIRLRFPEKLVERLLRVQWWRYDLAPHKKAVDFSEPDRALDVIEQRLADGTMHELRPDTFQLKRAGTGFELEPLAKPLFFSDAKTLPTHEELLAR